MSARANKSCSEVSMETVAFCCPDYVFISSPVKTSAVFVLHCSQLVICFATWHLFHFLSSSAIKLLYLLWVFPFLPFFCLTHLFFGVRLLFRVLVGRPAFGTSALLTLWTRVPAPRCWALSWGSSTACTAIRGPTTSRRATCRRHSGLPEQGLHRLCPSWEPGIWWPISETSPSWGREHEGPRRPSPPRPVPSIWDWPPGPTTLLVKPATVMAPKSSGTPCVFLPFAVSTPYSSSSELQLLA